MEASISLTKTAHLCGICGTEGPTCPILSDGNAFADALLAAWDLTEARRAAYIARQQKNAAWWHAQGRTPPTK